MGKNTQSHAHISRALVAALIGVVAIPTAMTGLFQPATFDGNDVIPVPDMKQAAIDDVSRVRSLRRNYWQAVDIYNALKRIGVENLTPPSINDLDSINYYLTPENFTDINGADEIVHAAAPTEEGDGTIPTISEAQAQYNALPEIYRDLLDGYIDTRRCPGSLRQYHLAGFYELCNQLLDERIANLQKNSLDRSEYVRGFHPVGFATLRTLKNRLENMQQSLIYESGSSIRPRWHSLDSFRPSLRSDQ